MTTITKERVAEIIHAAGLEPCDYEEVFGSIKTGEIVAMARIALASLEAEPVAYMHRSGQVVTREECCDDKTFAICCKVEKPLYTSQPALVSVPDAISTRQAIAKMENHDPCDSINVAYKFVWNACRAAMLQGSQPVSQSDELPLDYLQGHKDGLEWAAQLAEANHPQTGDWLYDDPTELARAIRKGPDMPELKSVPADADDNFYSWFGRFWSENYQQNNYTTSAKQMLGTMAEFAFRAGRESATQAGNSPVIPDGYVLVPKEPTEAMMLHKSGCQDHPWDDPECVMRKTRRLVWANMLEAAAPQQEAE